MNTPSSVASSNVRNSGANDRSDVSTNKVKSLPSVFDEFEHSQDCIVSKKPRPSISRFIDAFSGQNRSPDEEPSRRRIMSNFLPSMFKNYSGSYEQKRPKISANSSPVINNTETASTAATQLVKTNGVELSIKTKPEHRESAETEQTPNLDVAIDTLASKIRGSGPSNKDRISLRIYRTDGTFSTISCAPRATVQVILEQLARRFFINDCVAPVLYLRVAGIDMLLGQNVIPVTVIAEWLKAAGYPCDISMWSNDRWREDVAALCQIVCSNAPKAHVNKEELLIRHHCDPNSIDLSNCGLTAIPPVVFSNVSMSTLDLSSNWNLTLPLLVFSLRTRNLKELRLKDLNLQAIPNSLRHATSLSYLDLSCNQILELNTHMFEPLTYLSTLLLRGNRITLVPAAMKHIQSLKYLNLSCNQLDSVLGGLADLKSIIKLDLSYNLLTDLSSFPSIPHLDHLKLTGNQITALPASFARLNNLKKLDLQFNKLTEISVVLSLPLLNAINMTGNCLTSSIPPCHASQFTIRNNPVTFFVSSDVFYDHLTVLDLSDCQLTSLPSSVSNLKQMEKLIVNGNQLTCLDLDFESLTKLELLEASRNLLQSMPSGLERAKSLKVIDLHNNNLGQIDQKIWFSPALTQFNLASNLIKQFPTPDLESGGITLLDQHLRYLSLADNQLDDSNLWSAIYPLNQLISLNLSCNHLNDIPDNAFAHWPKLESFVSSGNNIGCIPSSIDLPKNLKLLCMNSNRLLSMPVEVGKLKNLEVLDLGCNQLKFNIHNYQYDWNWSWNRELRYLNLSGNRRFEIKEENSHKLDNDPATFKMLPKLKMLGLADVSLRSNVPLDNEYCRVRTAIGELGYIQFGVAELIPSKSSKGGCRDLVACRPRGFQNHNENMFVAVDYHPENYGRYTPNDQYLTSRLLMKLAELIDKRFIHHLAKSQDVSSALQAAFLDTNHRLSLDYPPTHPCGNRSTSEIASVGASASVVFIHGLTLHMANVGDICVILCRQGQAIVLSETHNLKNTKERNRVLSRALFQQNLKSELAIKQSQEPGTHESARVPFDDSFDSLKQPCNLNGPVGFYISEDGFLNGVTNLTRQFGCFSLATTVNAIPKYSSVELADGDEFVLVLSQTILSFVSPQVAVDIVRQERNDMSIAAEKLRDVVAGYQAFHKEPTAEIAANGVSCASKVGLIIAIGTSDLLKEFSRKAHSNSFENHIHLRPQRIMSRKMTMPSSQHQKSHDRILLRLDKEPDPPMGHVALVFTDVQNSTKLWELYPNAMQVAIKLHHQLFRRLLRNPGRGYEVKTEGDAFMVAFPTVFHASRWAIAVQEQLLLVEWPQEFLTSEDAKEVTDTVCSDNPTKAELTTRVLLRGIRVRMGIHCGYPVCERDTTTNRMDYYGRMVNRSARVSSSALGGEITISLDVLNELEEYHAVTSDETISTGSALAPLSEEELGNSPLHSPISSPLTGTNEKNYDPNKLSAAAQLRRLNPFIKKLGTVNLKGLENPETLWVMYPRSLQNRFKFLHPTAADPTLPIPSLNEIAGVQQIIPHPNDGPIITMNNNQQITTEDVQQNSKILHLSSNQYTESLHHHLVSLTQMVYRLESAAANQPKPDISKEDIWAPTYTNQKFPYTHFQSLLFRIENVHARLIQDEPNTG